MPAQNKPKRTNFKLLADQLNLLTQIQKWVDTGDMVYLHGDVFYIGSNSYQLEVVKQKCFLVEISFLCKVANHQEDYLEAAPQPARYYRTYCEGTTLIFWRLIFKIGSLGGRGSKMLCIRTFM